MTGPEWSTGDQRSLEVEIRKSANPEGVSLTPVTLTVLEASEEIGVRFEWQSGQTMVNGLPSSPEVDRLLEQTPREQIVYSLDRNRAFTGVENVDQIRSAYREIADLLGEAGMPQAEAGPGLFDGLSDEAVAQIFSERPVIYHSLEGIVLGFDETITFDDILPNAFGGEPFPAVTVIEITDLDDPDGCAEITMTVRPDPDDFLRILGESMQAAGLVDDENPFDPGDAGAEIENKIVAQYDTSTGFLRSVYGSQLIQFDGQRRFDETMIRDVTGR